MRNSEIKRCARVMQQKEQAIEVAAAEEGISPSEWLSRAVDHYIEGCDPDGVTLEDGDSDIDDYAEPDEDDADEDVLSDDEDGQND